MKVVCLRDYSKSDKSDRCIWPKKFPKKGNVYTVIGAKFLDGLGYIFEEIQTGETYNFWFEAKYFAPLDTFKQDELESELSEIFKENKELK